MKAKHEINKILRKQLVSHTNHELNSETIINGQLAFFISSVWQQLSPDWRFSSVINLIKYKCGNIQKGSDPLKAKNFITVRIYGEIKISSDIAARFRKHSFLLRCPLPAKLRKVC